jgi:hypothetical protein
MQASLQPFRAFGNAGSTDNGEQHVLERQINKTDCEVLRAYLSRRRELPFVVEGQPRASSPRLSDNLHCFLPSSVHICFGPDFHISLPSTSIFARTEWSNTTPLTWVSRQHLGGL